MPTMLSRRVHQARLTFQRSLARTVRRLVPARAVTLRHVEPGLRLRVNLRRNLAFWSKGLAGFEPDTVRAVRAVVQPGDRVFDVGANVGYFSTLFARLVGPEGRVVSFEPEPANQALLRQNLELNGLANAQIRGCAVGAQSGSAKFSVDGPTGATGHLGEAPTFGEQTYGGGALQLIDMQVESIDDVVDSVGFAPDVIKMDIEGGEIDALAGARRTLETHKPLILSEVGGEEAAAMITFLREADYRVWDLWYGHEVSPGDYPSMILAIAASRVDEERSKRGLAALGRRPR